MFVGIIKLKNGDKVQVNLSLKEFEKVQKDGNVPGGWKAEMKQVWSGHPYRWTWRPIWFSYQFDKGDNFNNDICFLANKISSSVGTFLKERICCLRAYSFP